MKRVFSFLSIFLLLLTFLWASDNVVIPDGNNVNEVQVINETPELKKKYSIKSHHQQLVLNCIHCHKGQGNNPEQFEAIGDEGCLSCHGSKKKMALRTGYMDMFHTNPHNSYHDGPTLSCDECHKEHEPSQNRCVECHDKEVPTWMKKVTP